ncbi:hypothetical protein, partial [Providencia sp. PROV069]|uniref:hypothetical protein n=1 Tax=Providencia sp. PROV069 TaxID=2949795 RepID=UPI00234BF58D
KAIPKQTIQANTHLSKHSVVKPYLDKLVAGSARRANPKDFNPARPTISSHYQASNPSNIYLSKYLVV